MGFTLTKRQQNILNGMNPAANSSKLGTKIRQLQVIPDDTKIYYGSDKDVSLEFNEDGSDEFAVIATHSVFTGDFDASGHSDSREFTANAFQYPAPGTDWTPAITGAVLANNKATKKVWLPLNFLKIGDEIVSYKIVGDMTEAAAETSTFDCKLVRVNKADPLTTTDVAGGTITQLVATGNFDSLATLSAVETVATDKQYSLEMSGTTDANAANEIKVIGAEVKVNRKV